MTRQMKTIEVMLYKGKKTFFSKMIAWKQWRSFWERYSKYTHVELKIWDMSFSSSEVDWGVRVKHIDYKKTRWDKIVLKVEKKDFENILSFCLSRLNEEYNWKAIVLTQICNWNVKNSDHYFCSEYVCEALQQASILCGVSAVFVNPAELALRLEKEWYTIEKVWLG